MHLKCETLEQAQAIEADISDKIGLPDTGKATRYAVPVERGGFYYLPIVILQYKGQQYDVESYIAETYPDIPQITAEEYQALWPVEEELIL